MRVDSSAVNIGCPPGEPGGSGLYELSITQEGNSRVVSLPLLGLQVVNGGFVVAPGAPYHAIYLLLLEDLPASQVFSTKAPHQRICHAGRREFAGKLQQRGQIPGVRQLADRHATDHVTIDSGHDFPFPVGCVQR